MSREFRLTSGRNTSQHSFVIAWCGGCELALPCIGRERRATRAQLRPSFIFFSPSPALPDTPALERICTKAAFSTPDRERTDERPVRNLLARADRPRDVGAQNVPGCQCCCVQRRACSPGRIANRSVRDPNHAQGPVRHASRVTSRSGDELRCRRRHRESEQRRIRRRELPHVICRSALSGACPLSHFSPFRAALRPHTGEHDP